MLVQIINLATPLNGRSSWREDVSICFSSVLTVTLLTKAFKLFILISFVRADKISDKIQGRKEDPLPLLSDYA